MRRFSPGRCCCTDCQFAADAFADTDLGDWTDVSGDWIDVSGERTTTSSSALIIHDTPHPDGDDQSQVARVTWRPQEFDDHARIILAYANPSNYLFAEVWIDAATGCGRARLWQRTGAINSPLTAEEPLSTMALEADHTLQLCLTLAEYPGVHQLVLRVTTAEGNLHSIPGDVLGAEIGDQAGLGTGAVDTGPVVFDDFAYLYHGDDYPGCPKCSGERDCLIGRDDFARAVSTDLGCDWEEEAGDWEIASEILTTADADAVALFQHAHPQNKSHVRASVSVRLGAVGDIARILVDWQDDENYHYGELEAGVGCGILRLFRVADGTPEQLGPDGYLRGLVEGEWHAAKLCFDTLGQKLRLIVQPGGLDADSHAWFPGGIAAETAPIAESVYLAGLGTGADALLVEFDGWRLERLQDATNDTCPECAHADCTLDRDNFQSSGLACVWEEIAGSWSAGSDALSTTSSNAFLLNRTPHPGVGADGGFDNTHRAAIHFGKLSYGDVFGLRLAYVDEDNYLFGRVTMPSAEEAADGKVEVGKVVGGTETVINLNDSFGFALWELGYLLDFELCYDGYFIKANLSGINWGDGVTPAILDPVSASGVAGTGFGPALSGIFTEGISGLFEISEANNVATFGTPLWLLSHDLHNANCPRCSSFAQCFQCVTVEGEGEAATTISKTVNWIAEVSGFVQVNTCPENPDPCWDWSEDVEGFNDIYILEPGREYTFSGGSCDSPFVNTWSRNCHWQNWLRHVAYQEDPPQESVILITLCEADEADPNTSPAGIKNVNLFILTGAGYNNPIAGQYAVFRKSFPYTRRLNGEFYENTVDCAELFGEDWIELDRWQSVIDFPPITPSNENVRVRVKAIPLV